MLVLFRMLKPLTCEIKKALGSVVRCFHWQWTKWNQWTLRLRGLHRWDEFMFDF